MMISLKTQILQIVVWTKMFTRDKLLSKLANLLDSIFSIHIRIREI